MAKKRAFVKYTNRGTIIPGSLIVTTQGGYPKNGIYKEVPAFANDATGDCDVIAGTISADLGMNTSTGSLDVSVSGVSVLNQTFPYSGYIAPLSFSQVGKVALLTLITGPTPTCPIYLSIKDVTTGYTTIYENLAVNYNTTFVYSWVLEQGHEYLIAVDQNPFCP
jgi:hypothetical protein